MFELMMAHRTVRRSVEDGHSALDKKAIVHLMDP